MLQATRRIFRKASSVIPLRVPLLVLLLTLPSSHPGVVENVCPKESLAQSSQISEIFSTPIEVPETPGRVNSSTRSCGESFLEDDVDMEFTTAVVPNQFLVHFTGYLTREDRKQTISKILADFSSWKLLQRNNPSYDLPSDFEILDVSSIAIEETKEEIVNVLSSNKEIKAVSAQKSLTRHLKWASQTTAKQQILQQHRTQTPPQHAAAGAPPPLPRGSGTSTRTRNSGSRRLMKSLAHQITAVLGAKQLWDLGITGSGIRVAVFDTGLPRNHPHFKKVKERTNWTDEKTLNDELGHGTFVAGVIAGSGDKCPGLAPDADLFIFRVFTNKQVSYTSWFLDAFNYAIVKRVHVLNLSIGGPDFMDQPFVDKVWELTANGITMISAIGNDGPLYGTHNNPADQPDVIGVGGINFEDDIAKFSSRGMTTWELPAGYGRVKPDIVTYGSYVHGSSNSNNKDCRSLSGTSVASPVVAGAVALLKSGVLHRGNVINPASVKQALMSTATRLPLANMFEQGAGKLDLHRAYQALLSYEAQASLSPPYLDLTECPYFWPYCTQGLYHSSLPLLVNVTVLNGMGVSGHIVGHPIWHPYTSQGGSYLDLSFKYSQVLWPWSGYLGIAITVTSEGKNWEGVAQGHVSLTVESPPPHGSDEPRISNLTLPVRVKIIPTPPKHKRVLWDQYHNLRYPPGYFPRDSLSVTNDPLDWNGDHPHTNFKGLYTALRNAGYYIEILGQPVTCLASPHASYGSMLIVDPEEEFFVEEIDFLQHEVKRGLSLIVFADWYNTTVMKKIQFRDDSTRGMWIPVTGGANIPALNDLLSSWGIALGDTVLEGAFTIGNNAMHFVSGSEITSFPRKKAATLLSANLKDQGQYMLEKKSKDVEGAVVLGLLAGDESAGAGHIAVYGDSNCLDDAHMEKPDCYWLMEALLEWVATGKVPIVFTQESTRLAAPRGNLNQPLRMDQSEFHKFSKVIEDVPNKIVHRSLPNCIVWEKFQPQPLNRTAPNDLYRPPLKLSEFLPIPSPVTHSQGARRIPLVMHEPFHEGNFDSPSGMSYGVVFSYLLMLCALVVLASQMYCRHAYRRRLCKIGRICNALQNSIRNV